MGKVKEAALLAIAKDDRLPEGHGALALAKLHYDWDFAGAEREFKRALELNPSDADIRHDYAHYLMAMGRMDESAAESRRAVDLDPVDDGLTDCLCWHRFAAHQYDGSIKMALDMLRRQPDDIFEMAILGWNYEQTGVPEQAVTEFKKAVELTSKGSPMYTFLFAGLGHAYALSGRKSDAEQILQALLEQTKQSYVSPFDIALIYSALGKKDTAFEWMTKAVAERSTWLVYSKWGAAARSPEKRPALPGSVAPHRPSNLALADAEIISFRHDLSRLTVDLARPVKSCGCARITGKPRVVRLGRKLVL